MKGETLSDYNAPPPPPPGGDYGVPPQAASSLGELAEWPARALGYLIDIALYIPGYILILIGGPKVDIDSATGALTTSGPSFLYYVGALYILGVGIWNRWLKGGKTGQTVGRGVIGTKLVAESTGQPIGAGMAFARDLVHIIDSAICLIGWLFPLWDAKKQTIADKLLNTVVVKAPKA